MALNARYLHASQATQHDCCFIKLCVSATIKVEIRDLRFSWRWSLKLRSSGLWRSVVWRKDYKVSVDLAASIFRVNWCPTSTLHGVIHTSPRRRTYFTQKMKAAVSSETLISYHYTSRCYNLEDRDLYVEVIDWNELKCLLSLNLECQSWRY
jgi:hypothetical protein